MTNGRGGGGGSVICIQMVTFILDVNSNNKLPLNANGGIIYLFDR